MEKEKKREKIRFQLHPKQAEVFHNDCRFRVVVAGRRWGKSKLSMAEMLAWATKKRQKIWYVAPTYKMAKQIMWNELKMMVPREWVTKIRENELSMEFRNGSRIDLKGADKPDSLRGVSLDFLVLDEFQDISPDTWKTVLRPTLADRKGHALFIGCVRGDTKVIVGGKQVEIQSLSKTREAKTLEDVDLEVYGLDHKNHRADGFWNNGWAKTLKIKTEGGYELEATPNHPIWSLHNGEKGWHRLEELTLDSRAAIDDLNGSEYRWEKIVSIEEGWAETFDFTIPDTHSFWSNGFISHNTPKGFNLLYEVYRLGQVKENQMRHKWMSWQFPTIVSPFIPQAEIDSARRDMDEKSFRQEFCHLPTTKVKLWDGGTRAIKDVRIGDALVYVGDHGRLERCTVTDKRNTGLQKMMRVTLDDGSTFTASKKHKIKYGQEKYQLCNAVYLQRWVNGWFKTLKVVKREELPPEECMNITVDSPDHSYLLADGIDNFNCASFESMSGRVYYAFDRKQHVADVEFNPKLPIWVGMDFNIDPMSTVIFQPQPNGQIWAVDEIVQVASNTDDICTELEKRYYKYQNQVTVYPDPAGSARQHARGESDLDIIREHGFKRIKVKRAHSAVADRINAVNRVLRTASGDVRLFINPKCKHLIESFEQTLYIAGTRDVDKALGVEHSADAAGYCIEIEFPLRKFTAAGYSR